VGIAALAISKGCGKRGKRLYVFLSFHQTVISTAVFGKSLKSTSTACRIFRIMDGAFRNEAQEQLGG
jgi:hypothetical protein